MYRALEEVRYNQWALHALARLRIVCPQVVAIDTETSGLEFHDFPFCATLSFRGPRGIENHYIALEGEGEERRKALLSLCLTLSPTWLFHNAKFDLQKLVLAGVITMADVEQTRIEDTSIVFHLLNENEPKGLKHLAREVLKETTDEEETLAKVRRKLKLKKADGYFLIPREFIIPYALKDTEFTLRLYETARQRIEERGDGLERVYALELQVMRTLLRMESVGFKLDVDFLKQAASEYGIKVMEGWAEIVSITGNLDFNPQSPMQLLSAFEKVGVILESTGESTLKEIQHPLAQAVLHYRSNKKIHTTYLQALQKENRNGMIHPNFNSAGARTGRMSSSKATA